MLILGCDLLSRYQQIAMAQDETGELLLERRLDHESGDSRVRGSPMIGSHGATLNRIGRFRVCTIPKVRVPH
jgi:hypothetical protein